METRHKATEVKATIGSLGDNLEAAQFTIRPVACTPPENFGNWAPKYSAWAIR